MAEKKATKKTAGTVNTATNRQEKKLAIEAALQAEAEAAVVAAIAKMPGLDRKLGEGLHALIKATPQRSRRNSGTGCLRMPGTARSCASSRVRRDSRRGTRRLASCTRRSSMKG